MYYYVIPDCKKCEEGKKLLDGKIRLGMGSLWHVCGQNQPGVSPN